MVKRTPIEIDAELLARAKRALGSPTTRATVEDALLTLLKATAPSIPAHLPWP